jgi:hypothetical protein
MRDGLPPFFSRLQVVGESSLSTTSMMPSPQA